MALRKILIVDDESLARERIVRFITDTAQAFDVFEACDGLEAVEKIASLKPDIVFLDIQMPGLNGFEVLAQIENKTFQIIFQTAYDDFALKAFEENACDYLLKPFPKERFNKAFLKALGAQDQNDHLKNLEKSLLAQKSYLTKIVLKHHSKTKVIDASEIVFLQSQDHYTIIKSSEGEFVSDLSLGHFEERLDPTLFVRAHRNNIVATKQIKHLGDTQNSYIELKEGSKVPLSRHRRQEVLTRLKGET